MELPPGKAGRSETLDCADVNANAMSSICYELSRLLEQFPADQHTANFGRAGADFIELGVAQQAAGGVIVDIAVAAEQLDRIERALCRFFGGIENGAGSVFARGLAAVAGFRHCIDVGARG